MPDHRHAARLLVVVVVASLAGCASPATAPGTALAPAPPAPTLPEQLPEADDGIVLPSPSPAAEGSVPEPSTSPDPVAEVAGYTGDDWAELLDGEVTVLAESVTVRDGTVQGLVRNGRSGPVGPVTVSAAGVTATVSLPVLRSGEPAPFLLEVADLADDADVEVAVEAADASGEPARGLRLGTFWQRGVSDPEQVDTYLYTDPETGPHPAVALGSARAAEAVEGLVVAAAWIDADGRVLAVDPTAELQAGDLGPGATVDFLVAASGPAALDDARLVLWASGS
ncbi:hypothetical protein [Salsipaludibacter albus]|uniref:hypothetical protein n=1 Tax=Salsipaludibacter albus TaxID=2849650 RepID=UPI001EE40492|nr:hypothetical protein [Salsipaludibacter albus]MBY5161210.1 hypothetical protein [Salsipaludibacter albus]